jgi:hypothetical protein
MPTIIECEECGRKLKVPDHFSARKARCKCGSRLSLDTAIKESPASRRKAVDTAVTTAPARTKPAKPKRPEPEERDFDDDEGKPKKKKKKKKKEKEHNKEGLFGIPTWVGYVAGMLAAIAATVIVIFWALSAGYKNHVIGLAIMVPISTVIFIASMVISSKIAGGIDFGQLHLAIMKAVILVLVTNLLSMIPGGMYFNALVWLVGLMYLFGLDLWETRFLLGINWLLNFWIKFFLIAALVNSSSSRLDWDDDDDDRPPRRPGIVRDLDLDDD